MTSHRKELPPLAGFWAPALFAAAETRCQTEAPAERSRQERFAPAAQSLERAESELTAQLAANPKDTALNGKRRGEAGVAAGRSKP